VGLKLKINDTIVDAADVRIKKPDDSIVSASAVRYYDGTEWKDVSIEQEEPIDYTEYEVGGTGPAGGYIFYDAGEVTGDGWRMLEAAPEDIEINSQNTFVWSNVETEEIGGSAQNPGIGMGLENTLAIINQEGHEESAAQLTVDYATENLGSTFGDWFLPSEDELNEMYTTLHDLDPDPSIGGFADDSYWSSTEAGTTGARRQSFATGSDFASTKSSERRVRPARAF